MALCVEVCVVSVYLLDKYFVQTPRPDYERISHLAELLTGELKDRPYLTQLLEKLESAQKMTQGRQIPFFQTTDADGKKINRTQFNDRMLLINVWASWDEASRKANAPLRKLYKQQKGNKDFAMLGIFAGYNFCRNILWNSGSIGDLWSSGTIALMNYAVGFKVLTGVGFLLLLVIYLLIPVVNKYIPWAVGKKK